MGKVDELIANGVPSSTQLLDRLEEEGKPVILNFSRGKDSLAVWHKLAERGIEAIPVHKSIVPGLKFIRDDLDRYEQYFQVKIHDLPSDRFYQMLNEHVFQPPERCAILEAAQLPFPADMGKEEMRMLWDQTIRETYATPTTFAVSGVAAADSATRMLAIKKYGPVNEKKLRMMPLWDHTRKDMWAIVHEHPEIPVGIDYEWYPRSFDGLRYDYLKAIKDNAPEDYDHIKSWFPLIDLELTRGGWDGEAKSR